MDKDKFENRFDNYMELMNDQINKLFQEEMTRRIEELTAKLEKEKFNKDFENHLK